MRRSLVLALLGQVLVGAAGVVSFAVLPMVLTRGGVEGAAWFRSVRMAVVAAQPRPFLGETALRAGFRFGKRCAAFDPSSSRTGSCASRGSRPPATRRAFDGGRLGTFD